MSMKRHTQGSSEDFEDKIDAAMADLEIDPDDEFHNADFYEEEEPAETSDREEKTDPEFDSWEEGEEDWEYSDEYMQEEEEFQEEYPEEEEYDQEEYYEDEEKHPEQELKVELILPRDSRGRGDQYAEQNTKEPSIQERDGSGNDSRHSDQENEKALSQNRSSSGKKGSHYSKKSSAGPQPRSARPTKINYVPISDEELDERVIPVRKKKHKGLKVTGIVAAMMVAAAGCAYGAVTYYYADRFFEGTYINGINCSNKTPYEVEQIIAANVENYSIQVTSRNQEPQTTQRKSD